MQDKSSDNKRLAKNTTMLYFRMFVMMAISLYTSRVILSSLGVSDFGIYNIVASSIMIIAFVTSSFAAASSRFITIAIGKGNPNEIKKTFGGILAIQIILAIFVLILLESIGLWLLNNKLVIPIERMAAAQFVYHISVISSIINIVMIPFNAEIIAHERMSAFAYMSILDASLKLLIVYILYIIPFDKLIIYSLLILGVQLLDMSIYYVYNVIHFPETRGKIRINKALAKQVMVYTSWTLTGAITTMACNQGVNLLLNVFFGPLVNAARGIAFQVQTVIQNFAFNFQTALNPQIVKSYAIKDYERINTLVVWGTKFSFYLLLLISLPLMVKIDYILSLWLVDVPNYTSSFIILLLIVNLVHCALANPLIFAINATGDIKRFQIVEGISLITIIPISYAIYKFDYLNPNIVFGVYLVVECITQALRMWIVLPKIYISIICYVRNCLWPIFKVVMLSLFISYSICYFNKDTFFNFIIIVSLELIAIILIIYGIGLTSNEKKMINGYLKKMFRKSR